MSRRRSKDHRTFRTQQRWLKVCRDEAHKLYNNEMLLKGSVQPDLSKYRRISELEMFCRSELINVEHEKALREMNDACT